MHSYGKVLSALDFCKLIFHTQKQSPKGILWKRCSLKFCRLHRKTLVPESLYLNAHVFSSKFCEILKINFFQNFCERLLLHPISHCLMSPNYNRLQNIPLIYRVSQKILIWSKSLTLLFGYFQQGNYKIEFLVIRLGTKLQFVFFISFHPNSLIF